jgi:hypothetical protein
LTAGAIAGFGVSGSMTYADGTANANGIATVSNQVAGQNAFDGTSSDVQYASYVGDAVSVQNQVTYTSGTMAAFSLAQLAALSTTAVAAMKWDQFNSLSPDQIKALHDANLLDDLAYGTDKPSMILNAITGTDIVSSTELAAGFNVKIDGAGFASKTVKLLLDNDRGTFAVPGAESSVLADYTEVGSGVADAAGHVDFALTSAQLTGGTAVKKFTAWTDNNSNGAIDAGETASRVFFVADGTAGAGNPSGTNYSQMDVITKQAFVYFYGDVDFGPQNGIGTDDMDGHMAYSDTSSTDDNGWVKGLAGNFAAKTYEFHMASLAADGIQNNSAAIANANDHQQSNDAVAINLADSNTSRAMSFEQMAAFVAANFSNTAGGFDPAVLDYLRDAQGEDGNDRKNDDISGMPGWQSSPPVGWSNQYHWTGSVSPRGHVNVPLDRGYVLDFSSGNDLFVAAVL